MVDQREIACMREAATPRGVTGAIPPAALAKETVMSAIRDREIRNNARIRDAASKAIREAISRDMYIAIVQEMNSVVLDELIELGYAVEARSPHGFSDKSVRTEYSISWEDA